MTLADTSVWIEHLRFGNAALAGALDEERVLIHPFVIGELACGSLKNRQRILSDLEQLPFAARAEEHEVLRLIHERKLWGKGIGWIDAHLLASSLLSGCTLWTLDKKLDRMAGALGIRQRA